jgi:hypothetical protein
MEPAVGQRLSCGLALHSHWNTTVPGNLNQYRAQNPDRMISCLAIEWIAPWYYCVKSIRGDNTDNVAENGQGGYCPDAHLPSSVPVSIVAQPCRYRFVKIEIDRASDFSPYGSRG